MATNFQSLPFLVAISLTQQSHLDDGKTKEEGKGMTLKEEQEIRAVYVSASDVELETILVNSKDYRPEVVDIVAKILQSRGKELSAELLQTIAKAKIEQAKKLPQQGEAGFNDFITFRKMLAPILIKIFFWIGVIGCVISGVAVISEESTLGGLVLIFVGPFALRILCEMLIVVFMINETLTDVKNILKSKNG